MNFIFENNETEAPLPIAFIDSDGDLWFRTNDADNIDDNVVHIMTKRGDIMDEDITMFDFIGILNGKSRFSVKPVKTFYEGDTVTIQF